VITQDAAVHELDPKTLTDSPAADDEQNVFSDGRVVRGPLPAISSGSLIEEEDTWTENKPIFGAGSVTRFFVGRSDVLVHKERLTIDSPATLPLRYELQLLPDTKPVRSEENGRIKLLIDYGQTELLDEPDTNLPSNLPQHPNIAFSTAVSWRHVAKEYGKTVDEQIDAADVSSLVRRLIEGKKSRDDKAMALLQYLDREVRYTGVEFDDAAIIPRPPAETLKRKYGDCKDKSTLLVAMLRAAGIPAYIALLRAGRGHDVAADLPGIGLFDHAIVFVPGSPELWLDATDEFARVGQLPLDDQGRLALVARPESTALTPTPVSSSEDNLLIERREFHLSENGPAGVVETSEPHGSLESVYRSDYTDTANKDTRKNLSTYVQSQYLAEKLDRIDAHDPDDISKQFTLVLESDAAKRGFTDLDSAVVAIRFDTLFNRLPDELEQGETEDDKSAETANGKPKKVRTANYQLPMAFVTEWQYTILPPPGFRPKPLPANQALSLGPASLTENFSADSGGVVHAMIRFDTVKRILSVSEAHQMRDKIVELRTGPPTFVYFEPVAQVLLNQGKVRESLQAYRDLIALHPNESVHHLQLAEALLSAGLGQAARDEARRAVALQPESALAQKTLAKVLECDLGGRKLTPGSDYSGAETAFRTARKLDPSDNGTVGDFAIFLEYNNWGERYGPGAKLKESVEVYQSLTPEQLDKIGLKGNLAYTLLYAGQFSDARKYAEDMNPQIVAVIIASEAAMNGSQAGISEASKRSDGEVNRKNALMAAGQMLMRRRMYSLAADLMESGASGDNAADVMTLASVLSKARPNETLHYDDDPAGFAMRTYLALKNPMLTKDDLLAVLSKNGRTVLDLTDPEKLETDAKQRRRSREQLSASGIPADVMLDIEMQSLDVRTEGDDASGYRVTLRVPGQSKLIMYVVKEDGKYKLLDTSNDADALGLEVLDRLEASNLAGARVLLDWLRDSEHVSGGDDPFNSYVFPRIWTKGKDADVTLMRVAAAAILVQSKPTARQGVTILEANGNWATSDADKVNLALALTWGYGHLQYFDKALLLYDELAKQYPESVHVFYSRELDLRRSGRFQEADALAEERLKRIPDDIDARQALVLSANSREDYALARDLGLKLIASGKAGSYDFNQASWDAILTGKIQPEDLANATKAVELSRNDPSTLHTLACVYAELGRTRDAREILIQAMNKLNLDEPDSDFWYAFGLIADQYGETEAAKADYSRVEKPARSFDVPGSTYVLAQAKLKILGGVSDNRKSSSN
jgi:transglutaminase-like putative cysteine protease/tetratricopeptide (TPR) repeat protein